MPPELAETAISLSMASGREVDRLALLAAILARTEAWYDRLLAGESPHAAWAARLDTLGRRVTVTTALGVLAGLAVGVTTDGALLVRDDAGREQVVWSGDVSRGAPCRVGLAVVYRLRLAVEAAGSGGGSRLTGRSGAP